MNDQKQSIYKVKKNRNKEHNLFYIYYSIYIYMYIINCALKQKIYNNQQNCKI